MKRKGDYNQSPRHGKIIKPTQQQQQAAYDRLGFIQGGAFLRSNKAQNYMANQVKQAVLEKKGFDTNIDIDTAIGVVQTTNTNADTFVLNLIQPGNGSWNRVGRKVHLRSLRLRFIANHKYSLDGTTTAANTLRMIVVWDKQPSGAAIPAFDTIFGVTSQLGTESTTFLNPTRYDNMDRFQILRDKCWDSNPQFPATAVTQGSTNICVDEFIKLGNREVVFSGQSNPMTIADISTGALYVIFRSERQSADGLNNWNINESNARVRYND